MASNCACPRPTQNLALGAAVGIAHPHPHQETVELGLGQRIGAVMFDRILRGNHQKRLRQRVGMRIHRHLAFVHGFEQGRLGLRRSAIDLIGQQHVGEHRAALEFELLFDGGVDRDPQNIGGKHVAGELHPLKGAIEGPGQGLSQRGLADAGYASISRCPRAIRETTARRTTRPCHGSPCRARVPVGPRDEKRHWRFQGTLEGFYYASGMAVTEVTTSSIRLA